MIEYKLQKLTDKQKQWLYDAVIKIVISDKEIDESEMDDLIQALEMRGVDVDERYIKKVVRHTVDTVDLEPFEHIDFESALIILTEVVKSSAVDGDFPECERALIEEVAEHLQFSKKALGDIFDWADKLVEANLAEKELSTKLSNLHGI